MISLVSVYRAKEYTKILYDLLKERPPEASISHKSMPTMEEHVAFVGSFPYRAWYLILNEIGDYVGSVYLTKQREIGIFVFKAHQGRGYGREAVEKLMAKWPGKFYANIAPRNEKSHEFFKKLGFTMLQHTYVIDTNNRS